ncbi:MAG: hypothetical protein JRJ87_24215 [Deltaproteobacteria bacterium]|nr:hypothetical protein [Deltaproteobacteria bacterium]
MRTITMFLCFFVLLGQGALQAADPIDDPEVLESYPKPTTAYYKYLQARRLECTGDGNVLDAPVEMKIGKQTFTYSGPALTLKGKDPDGVVTLGVMGAVKDFGAESKKALKFYMDQFEKDKVDAILLLGDIAASEFELTQILLFCAKRGWPVLALIGNSEGRAAFNRAMLAALKAADNIINMDFVRRVDLGGAVLVSLPGYLDRRFVHQTSGCTYKRRDIKRMRKLLKGIDSPIVFVSHGPPKGSGNKALDYAAEGGNVGDQLITDFLRDNKIAFGLFSHIIEAGGQTVDSQGKAVAENKWVDSLNINVGSANPLSWQLNSGKLSCGMAATVRIKESKASYKLLNYPCK